MDKKEINKVPPPFKELFAIDCSSEVESISIKYVDLEIHAPVDGFIQKHIQQHRFYLKLHKFWRESDEG